MLRESAKRRIFQTLIKQQANPDSRVRSRNGFFALSL
jgi:hypothetical protein